MENFINDRGRQAAERCEQISDEELMGSPNSGSLYPAIVCNDAGRTMIQVTVDFRHAECAEQVETTSGEKVWMLYCEEFTDGRWEPFNSLVNRI